VVKLDLSDPLGLPGRQDPKEQQVLPEQRDLAEEPDRKVL